MISAIQRNALKAWVVAAINDGFAGTISAQQVRWAGRDFPRTNYPYVVITILNPGGNLGAQTEEIPQGTDHNDAQISLRDLEEVVVSFEVANKQNETPSHEQDALVLASRLKSKLWSRSLFEAARMRALGLAPVRVEAPVDIARLAGGSQWETRYELGVTFHRTEVTIETPGSIETVEGLESVNPVTADEPFTITE